MLQVRYRRLPAPGLDHLPGTRRPPACDNIYGIMRRVDRRAFLAAGITAASGVTRLLAASGGSAVDETLRSGIARRKIPAVVGDGGERKQDAVRRCVRAARFSRPTRAGGQHLPDSVDDQGNHHGCRVAVGRAKEGEAWMSRLPSIFRNLKRYRCWRDTTPAASRISARRPPRLPYAIC